MKKYSRYFKTMLFSALVFWFIGVLTVTLASPAFSVIFFTVGFILWFAGVMAPDHEKYVMPKNKYTPKI